GLVAVAELPAVVASAGLGAPAAELPAGRAHRERVGARDAIQGRIELPAVATDRGPVQHELGGPGLDDLPRLGEAPFQLVRRGVAALDRVCAIDGEALLDPFALETSVRRLDGPLGELHAVRRDRHRAAAQIVGFALSDERGLDVDVWCVQALHGDIGLTAVQGAELALVAGLAGVL